MRVKKITSQNFRRYGRVIEYPQKEKKGQRKNLFCIVLKEANAKGWRIAYLVVRDQSIRRLENHPFSFESFETVKGRSLLYVAMRKEESKIECFNLDKPIILKKGIWHGVVSLTQESEIKITENAEVQCVYWPLKEKLGKFQKG